MVTENPEFLWCQLCQQIWHHDESRFSVVLLCFIMFGLTRHLGVFIWIIYLYSLWDGTRTNETTLRDMGWVWRHNEHDGVSNHQPHDCLLNRLFRRRSMKTSKLCVTGLCAGNSPVTGEFPAQRVSNAENVSIWWRHHWTITMHNKTPTVCVIPRKYV